MFFSLGVEVQNALGEDASTKRVKQDLRKILANYRHERGWFRSMRLTKKRILFAFKIYKNFCNSFKDTDEMWNDFLNNCEETGAEFLEYYID